MKRFYVEYDNRTVTYEDGGLLLEDKKEEGLGVVVSADDAGMKIAMEWVYRR